MNNFRRNAVWAGIFFLTAMISSLSGGMLVEAQTTGSREALSEGILQIGIVLELINAFSVLGIAAALFPVISGRFKSAGAAYLGIRIVEVLICTLAALIPAILFTLPGEQGTGSALLGLRLILMSYALPLVFSVGAFILYTVLLKAGFVPRFISLWGLAATALILALNIFPIPADFFALFALPIILNEIFLGIWLIAKGLKQTATEN